MLHIELPRAPVPGNVADAVEKARIAVAEARASYDQVRIASAEADYAAACQLVREHYATVGVDRFPIPREVEAKGPAAVQGFIDGQAARLADESKGEEVTNVRA